MEPLTSELFAITPEAHQGILAVSVRGETDEVLQAVEARLGRPLENTHRAEMRGSVAVIPVVGPLFRRSNLLTHIIGASDYGSIAQDLRAAVDNPAVKAIVLNVDSPGGMANGAAELASHIREANTKKPVTVYVGGMAASAAYWLASAATRIVASKTAMLGSIGVVVGVDRSGNGADVIRSSQSPKKNADPTTAEGRAQIQARVDNLAAIFIEEVASFRGVSVDHVLTKFGKGDVLLGESAKQAGMVDSIGTYEGLIGELNAGTSTRGQVSSPVFRGAKPKAPDPKIERLRSVYQEKLAEHLQIARIVAGGEEAKVDHDAVACAALDEAKAICGIAEEPDESENAFVARMSKIDDERNPRGLFIRVPAEKADERPPSESSAEVDAFVARMAALDALDEEAPQSRASADPGVAASHSTDEGAHVKRMLALDEADTEARRGET